MSKNNTAAWAEIHAAARAEFPDAMNDPRRKQPGRAWWHKKNGTIVPSSPETVAACKRHLAEGNAAIARNAQIEANLERHANDKARRHSQITGEATAKHIEETRIRYARQQARRKNPNRFDALYFVGAIVFVYLMVRIVMGLAGV